MGQSYIPFSSAAQNLGVISDSQLALKEQLNRLCQLTYLEIRQISFQQYLSFEATKTLVSLLDYCNALLHGSPQVLLDKIHSDELLSWPRLQC